MDLINVLQMSNTADACYSGISTEIQWTQNYQVTNSAATSVLNPTKYLTKSANYIVQHGNSKCSLFNCKPLYWYCVSLNGLKVKVHSLADVVAGVCLEEPLHTFASLVSRPVLPSGTAGVHGRVREGDPTTRSLHSLVITYQDALTRLGPRVVAERL